jgi:uncharacterized membrane-anchored protein YhcB (DUF1043 family)
MLNLAPDEVVFKQVIAGSFKATNQVNGWVQALIQSSIVNTIPPQDCITSIQTSFSQCVTSLESSWVEDLMPKLKSDIPQAFVSFSETFGPIAENIGNIMGSLPSDTGNPTAQQKQTLQGLVTDLQQSVNQNITTLQSLMQKSKNVISQIKSFYTTVTQGAQSAQQVLKVDAKDILNLQNQIAALQQKLSDDEAKLDPDQDDFLSGMGDMLYNFTFGLALNTMKGEPEVSLGDVFTSALEIGESVATIDADTSAVEDDVQNLATLEDQLSAEELAVAALYGTVNTVKKLAGFSNGLLASLPMVLGLWTTLGDACGQLLEIFQQPAVNLCMVSMLENISTTTRTWNNISQYADSVLDVSVTPNQVSLNNTGN